MTLIWILAAVIISGGASLTIAAFLSFATLSKVVDRMVSLSVGVMLSTTFLHALPEAFSMTDNSVVLCETVLAGLFGFFLLQKFAILRHNHHHEGDGHDHEEDHDKDQAGASGWMILVGDSFHNFTDGVMIAAAFLADFKLGIVTSLAICIHEIPQEVGDFIVLLNAGFTKARAYIYNLLSSVLAILGGILGYFLLEQVQTLIPYVLALASSGFIYIAVSDLIPQMQKKVTIKESVPQVILIAAGVVIIFIITHSLHSH